MEQKTKKLTPLKVTVITLFGVYMLIPILATYFFSVSTRWDRTIMPEGYTFSAYIEAFNLSYFKIALQNSLTLAILSCCVSFVLIVPTVYWVQNYIPRAKSFLDLIMILPFAIPTVVLALSYIRVFTFQPVTRSPGLLVMATVVFTMPFMYRAVSNGIEAVDIKTLTEAAQSLGANIWHTMLRVILPNISPGILSGMLLVFATVFADFTLAKLICGARFKTFPMLLVEQTAVSGSVSAALSVISFSTAWVISLILLYLSSKSSKSHAKDAKH